MALLTLVRPEVPAVSHPTLSVYDFGVDEIDANISSTRTTYLLSSRMRPYAELMPMPSGRRDYRSAHPFQYTSFTQQDIDGVARWLMSLDADDPLKGESPALTTWGLAACRTLEPLGYTGRKGHRIVLDPFSNGDLLQRIVVKLMERLYEFRVPQGGIISPRDADKRYPAAIEAHRMVGAVSLTDLKEERAQAANPEEQRETPWYRNFYAELQIPDPVPSILATS